MKVAVYTSYGPPDVVQNQDVEKPEPSDNEVLIQVRAAAVNPLDMVIKGRPYLARLITGLCTPKVTPVGVDVAGQVEAVRRHVTQFKPGDEGFGARLRDPHAARSERLGLPGGLC
jgi:NADPH:quinone reductase-like Zn-dependent oxidoreductase